MARGEDRCIISMIILDALTLSSSALPRATELGCFLFGGAYLRLTFVHFFIFLRASHACALLCTSPASISFPRSYPTRACVHENKQTGMVGMMGAGALTKKRGGYTNTKLHGMMAWAGVMLAGGGLYVIYKHKNVMGKDHFTTLHSWGEFIFVYDHSSIIRKRAATRQPRESTFQFCCSKRQTLPRTHILYMYIDSSFAKNGSTKIIAGLAAFGGCISAGLAGGVFLHPDFGVDKQNKLIRSAHKYLSRSLLILAWMATISGLKTLVGDDVKTLILFAAPLLVAAPFTLI